MYPAKAHCTTDDRNTYLIRGQLSTDIQYGPFEMADAKVHMLVIEGGLHFVAELESIVPSTPEIYELPLFLI